MNVNHSLGDMLARIGPVELTPPVYFVTAWLWTHAFGDSEFAIRSLSALCGLGTVAVLYMAARELLNRRAGLIVAWLAAVNPLLIWYSQEARSYSLMVFLSAVSFLFFVRAMKGDRRSLLWWGIASAFAMATHYLAAALLAPEALLLLLRSPHTRRQVALGIAPIVIAGLALLPLLANQVGHGSWISELPLRPRAFAVPPHMATGFYAPFEALPWIALAGLAAAVVFVLRRGSGDEREGLLIAGAVGLGGAFILLAPLVNGSDYVLTRNLLALWVPFGVAAGVALSARKLDWIGPAATAVLVVVSIGLVIWMETDAKLQRPGWRQLYEAVEPPTTGERYWAPLGARGYNSRPLEVYVPGNRQLAAGAGKRVLARELLLARMKLIDDKAVGTCFWGAMCNGNAGGLAFESPPGFTEVESGETERFYWWTYRAPKPFSFRVDDRGRLLQPPG